MITKHFFKTLLLFMVMIAIGLLGVFAIGELDKKPQKTSAPIGIAK